MGPKGEPGITGPRGPRGRPGKRGKLVRIPVLTMPLKSDPPDVGGWYREADSWSQSETFHRPNPQHPRGWWAERAPLPGAPVSLG